MLGKSSVSRGSGNQPKPKPGDGKDDDEHVPTPEEVEAEAYKKALASLKKAIRSLSSSLDKGAVLKESLCQMYLMPQSKHICLVWTKAWQNMVKPRLGG